MPSLSPYPFFRCLLVLGVAFLAGTIAACSQRVYFADTVDAETRTLPPCDATRTAPTYRGVDRAAVRVELIDCGLPLAARLTFAPDGQFLFAALLNGLVYVYERTDDGGWRRQTRPFYDLGPLGVSNQSGLTGLFLGANFDAGAADPVRRDVFLTYQRLLNGERRNRILRLTFAEEDGHYVGTNRTVIYTGPEPTADAHQVHDGVAFTYHGAPHLLVSFGDAKQAASALDLTQESRGKLLLMQRDGAAPLGPRPWPDHPRIAAIGLRNTYGLLMLPPAVDSLQRVLGVENGNDANDRIWLAEVVDVGGEVHGPLSFNYAGSDTTQGWKTVTDVNMPGPFKRNAVLFPTISPPASPASVALHPGHGPIAPPAAGEVVFVVSFFGTSGSKANRPGKTIAYARIGNLRGASYQIIEPLTPLVRRIDAVDGAAYGHPVAMDVDPQTGDIVFSDIVTGELNRARLLPRDAPVTSTSPR